VRKTLRALQSGLGRQWRVTSQQALGSAQVVSQLGACERGAQTPWTAKYVTRPAS
jgi:hypothetical protein